MCVPYRNTRRSYDWDETFTSCYKHAHGGFGNLKILKIELAGVSGVAQQSDLEEILHKSSWNFTHLTFKTGEKSLPA